ncbi:MAG: CHASE2 domain-containing protein [Spirochaetota bacterium]
MKKADRITFGIPVILVAIVLALNVLPQFKAMDLGLYDQLLRFRPAIEEDERFLILEIDDDAIAEVGGWPWSRDIVADGLWTLKEFDADRIVFDIEYIDPSPAGIDRDLLEEEIPEEFDEAFSAVSGNAADLIQSVSEGRLSPEEAVDFLDQYNELTEREKNDLLSTVREVARDNDEYLGRAAEVFGDAFFTVSMIPDPRQIAPTTEEDLEYAKERYGLLDAPENNVFQEYPTIQPVIRKIGEHGAGAGFTNIVVDEDGVRRRVNLFAEYDGKLFPQLAFRPLLGLLGDPDIEVDGRTVHLRDAQLPDSETSRDIRIPLSRDGRLAINWPQKSFAESFRHEGYRLVYLYQEVMNDLYSNISIMRDTGYLDAFPGTPPTQLYEEAEEIKQEVMFEELEPERFEEYRELRVRFLEETEALLTGDTEEFLTDQISSARDNASSEEEAAEYEAILEEIDEVFSATRDIFEDLQQRREDLRESIEDSFIVIGQTGVGTVDVGVNPFEGQYFNVGTHAAVANTILQEDFLVFEERWVSVVLTAILGLLVGVGTARLDAKKSVFFGVLAIILVAASGTAYFFVSGRYIAMAGPLLAVGLTFVGSSATSAVRNSAERAFLRNAFSRYLSADVIGQILDDPSKLALGGEKKYLTAMFTDIQGFSTISEQLDPSDLVRLLNAYLTEMSNIVLDVHGTIDKYEGDAIIAFFGAPVDDPDHAANACLSAVRMKRVEADLNERFLAENMSPSPLATRIGINTGEMVVGNMGTERQMDYTIMGHAVNLAARLEGVNKQYGSYILVSEATREESGDAFVFRPLDRVRVVGVSEPVQLYELLDERSAASSAMLESSEQFAEAIRLFQNQQFTAARKLFADLVSRNEKDMPSQTYVSRCAKLQQTPPPASWDGVYNLTQK